MSWIVGEREREREREREIEWECGEGNLCVKSKEREGGMGSNHHFHTSLSHCNINSPKLHATSVYWINTKQNEVRETMIVCMNYEV